MRIIFVFVFVLLLGMPSLSDASSKILEPTSCHTGYFENYNSWVSYLINKKRNFNIQAFKKRFPIDEFEYKKAMLDCVNFKYKVDGLNVEGFYVKPKNSDSRKLPVVIYNRGGNGSYGYVVFGKKMDFISDVAANGFLVIGSQYRGASVGRIENNGHDEFGGRDVNDVLALLSLVEELPDADLSKVALLGWSRGVVQSYIAAKSMQDNVKAIVAIAGNVDAKTALEWRPSMEKVYSNLIPDFNMNRESELRKRSAIMWLDNIPDVPILLVHGDADTRVNVEQSKTFSKKLAELQRPHKLVIYDKGTHGLFKYREELLKEVVIWLKEHT